MRKLLCPLRTGFVLLLSVFPLASAAAAPSVVLNTSLDSSGSTLDFSLTPSSSAAGCTYELHGAASQNRLRETLGAETLLRSLDGSVGISSFAAEGLQRIRRPKKKPRRNYAKLYFVARLICGSEESLSNIASERQNYRRSGGARNIPRWFRDLQSKFVSRELKLQRAFANLSFTAPIDLQNAGDGSNRLFVAEQAGRIQVFQNDQAVAGKTEFLDIRSRISSGGERGLLGLAFHPNYSSNGFFFVNYTRSGDGATVISRFQVSANANVADSNSELILLVVAQPFANHNGGQIAFGPDGYLYIALGDGGSANDPQGNGQDRTALLGKILRIDVDNATGGRNYAIPPSNPFVGNTQGYREEIFAYGFRNPWRFSFDPETGRLWAGDVGQGQREEIDVVTNGANYGWNTMEGSRCFNPSSGCDQSGLTLPVFDYSHALGASISGGHVYRGSNNPSLSGNYIYGDFISGSLWALQYDGSTSRSIDLFSTELNIAAFGIDENRELYFLSYADGVIYTFVSE